MSIRMSVRICLATGFWVVAGPLAAQTLLSGDHSIDGNLCAGPACTGSETWGIEDLKIKDETPRLLFEDTSPGGEPTVDWMLVGNDSSTVGMSYFAITNADLGRQIVKVESNAPANGLYLDAAGELGLGTAFPQREIHMIGGDANTIRFEQDGSGIDPAQTWDILADHLGVSLIDQTNGVETLRVEPGAGSSAAFTIEGNGEIGFGTFDPTAALHLLKSDGTAKILVEETGGGGAQELFQMKSNGGSYFTLSNTTSGRDWFFVHENNVGGRFIITSSTNPSEGLFLEPGGDLTIGGTLTTGGTTCGGGCDLVFSDAYDLPSIREHAEAMWSLGHLPNVGPTLENAPINVSDKLGRMLNELEHAHIYIAELEADIRRIPALEARLAKLEAQLSQH